MPEEEPGTAKGALQRLEEDTTKGKIEDMAVDNGDEKEDTGDALE